MVNPVILLFVISASFCSALGLTCLSCTEIAHPRYCHAVAQCGGSQTCYTKLVTTTDQRNAYELGCSDQHTLGSMACNTTQVDTSGQRCLGCCASNLCNAALCGERGYPKDRGPICYSCDSRERGEPCNQVTFCGVGEVCSIEERVEFSTVIYIAECRPKHVCDSHSLAIIGKRSVKEEELLDLENTPDLGTCHSCCSEDLCNTNCSTRTTTGCATLAAPANGAVTFTNTYLYKSVVTFSCNTGFTLSGNPTRTCKADGSWSSSSPKCNRNSCVALVTPTDGSVTFSNTHMYESVATFSCNVGFTLSGNYTSTCQADGTWSSSSPTCNRNTCATLAVPTDGTVTFTNTHMYESVATFSCDAGFTLSATQSRTCLAGGSWSSSSPTCNRISCATLATPTDGSVTFSNTHLYESVATFSCNAGFILSGTQTRTCQADGYWSSSSPTCNRNSVDCSSFSGASTTSNISDIYQIWMPRQHVAKRVVCDINTDGGGWMVIQRRFNGSVSFYRNFSDYEHGFGDLSGEFWMGLRDVQELISCGNTTWELRFDLEDAEGNTGYQTYQDFRLAPRPKYTLHIGQANGTANRKHGEGYAGFTNHNNSDFSTYDHGPDRSTFCATELHGGWWYYGCADVNINGEYVHPPGSVSSYNGGLGGMIYGNFDNYRSLKSTEMKIRRVSGPGC